MINYLFSLFQDPKKGFDPVPAKYADMYFEQAHNGQRFNKSIIDQLKNTPQIKNKKVLDLGAGSRTIHALFCQSRSRHILP